MKSLLSQAQLGIYYTNQTSADEQVNYQNAVLFSLPESVDLERLQKAILDTIAVHPYLCSCIKENAEKVPEVISTNAPCSKEMVPVRKVSEAEWKEVQKTFARPMDIHGERLFRTEIYKVESQKSKVESYLYLDVHHVLSDGASFLILVRDISKAYNGQPLTPETMDGAAIAQAESAQRADKKQMSEVREWYAHTFCDAVETDSLPIPEPQQSEIPNPEQRYQSFPLSFTKEEVQAIRKRFDAKEETIMQTAWTLLLAAYSGEEKASYCTPYFGRNDRNTLNSVTMMAHTLPVFANWGNRPSAMPLKELMTALVEQQQQARKYLYYSYPDAVQDLGLNNQVMFVYQGKGIEERQILQLGDGKAQMTDLRKPIPKWKICVEWMTLKEQYLLQISYNTGDYSEAFIREMAKCYSTIIRSMVNAETVKDIDYCSPDQIAWLDQYKKSKVESRKSKDESQKSKVESRKSKDESQKSKDESLVGIFKKHVAEHPDAICVVAGDKRLTYAEVDKLSDTLDPQYTIPCGEHVIGYSVPRNEQMIIVPLSIAKAGMTAMPLDSSYPEERLEFMRGDATNYDGKDAFILLYTSGTTGTPKGVMLSEDNILTFCESNAKLIGLTPESRYATYAGYGFDAFMHDLWGCMYVGCAIYVIGEDIRFDLEGMHDYFEQEGITNVFMTTQVGTQMAINYPDIKGMKVLVTGGEKLMSINPPRSYKLLNAYGPTETTVYVTTYEVTKKEPNIPIGYPLSHVELFIVNKQGKRVPWGAAGELLIAGPQVGLGYLNQPEKTKEAFVSFSPKYGLSTLSASGLSTLSPKDGLRCYKTGDVVRYRQDGAIEFVGRKDGQVKIRGFRIELKEVEAVIRQFEGIKDATVQAFDYPDGGGKFIAAYIVSDQKIDIQALNAFIMDQKPPYMVPAVTMQIDAIPLNQNQKVNKRALPEPKANANANAETNVEAAPLNVLEEQLREIVAGFVGNSDFGITTDLRYVGLSSISAIKLATQIYKRFGVQLDAKKVVKGASIQSIENEILKELVIVESRKSKDRPSDSKTPSTLSDSGLSTLSEAVSSPLSNSQTGVYFECMKNPTSTLYNIPMRTKMPASVTEEELRKAIIQVVNNHPGLFVHFQTNDNGVVQIIDRDQEVVIKSRELKETELDAYLAEFVHPFNLSKDLLCRFTIAKTEEALYLFSDIHHLVCDGASYDVFYNELCALLDGESIEPEMCSYAQFVADEQAAKDGAEYTAAKEFFHSRLAEVEGPTELEADITNPKGGEIAQVSVPIDLQAAEKVANHAGITPAGVCLAAVYYTLGRFANTDELCITTISNGRSNLKMSNTMGMMVNTLAMSCKIGNESVQQFVKETGEAFEQTLAHENYPFAQIAADYDLTAEIMFAYQIGVIATYKTRGQALHPELMELNVPKFKIAFYVFEVEGIPSVVVEYDNGRYSQAMMQSLAQSVCNAVTAFAKDDQVALRSVSLLDAKQTAVLDSFNETHVDYDDTQTVLSLFKQQVAAVPDNIAVIFRDKRITYRELDEITDRIAAGLHPTTNVIAIMVGRSEWMPIGALAVMKTGCAYMPLDPSYPEERLQYMQKDGNSCMLLTEKELESLSANGLSTLSASGLSTPKPEDLFILLYTSGSTGVPKGVMLEHRNLVAFCHWYHRYYDLQPSDKVAAYASFGFDACMMDMYSALTRGAAVCSIPEDLRLNLPELGRYFDAEGITHSFMTTQIGCQFAANVECHSLKHLSVGGEALLPLNPPTTYKFHNGYGPTECTVFTTIYQVSEYEQHTPIGKPLDNLQLFIMDTNGQRLPLGAAGELWVSGPQVGRGYLNLPEKTAEAFVSFSPKDGLRCYRTGDIVRYLPDGNIQFVGRRDGQVKIRGFRIELKEVEAIIREFPGIKDATVQAFDYPNGGKYIAAYIVSDEQIDIQALHAFIRESKPPYMVPAATMQIDAIPLNQNQKVNRKALPAPKIQADDRDYVAPANDTEKLFAGIFAGILSLDKVGATDNFFELGGTSLMVTRVIIEAEKAGKHIAYSDLFSHPTPRALSELVDNANANANANTKSDTEITDFDYEPINELIQKNNLDTFLKGLYGEADRMNEVNKEMVNDKMVNGLGHVLLTGATGFLGIHVLRELIDSDAETITCLVRGKDQKDAERRVRNLLFYYFNRHFDELFGTRLFVIPGDVTSDFGHITGPNEEAINTVFNCAANVKHFSKGTDIEDVNTGGAQRCVDFCLATGAALVHVSTTSIGGIWIGKNSPKLTERNLYFGQYLDNQYMRSKFLADRLILDAIVHKGLKAKIMRVGNLAARSYDGEFQVNFTSNSYMGRIKIFKMLGCCTYEQFDELTEFSPINETAKAIVLLAHTPDECTVFQPYNTHRRLLGDVLTGLKKIGTELRLVENEEFNAIMQKEALDPKKAALLTPMLAYQDMANGQPAQETDRDNAYTSQVLLRLGFRWTELDSDYFDKIFIAISQLGFFDV